MYLNVEIQVALDTIDQACVQFDDLTRLKAVFAFELIYRVLLIAIGRDLGPLSFECFEPVGDLRAINKILSDMGAGECPAVGIYKK